MTEKQCAWVENQDANWETGCGETFVFVGDKVVLAQSYSLDTVHEIKRIENLTPHINGSETTYFLENSLGCWLFQIKHATDEEIKAGKRLEVK